MIGFDFSFFPLSYLVIVFFLLFIFAYSVYLLGDLLFILFLFR